MISARYQVPPLGELGYGSVPTERHSDYPATLIPLSHSTEIHGDVQAATRTELRDLALEVSGGLILHTSGPLLPYFGLSELGYCTTTTQTH
jgi:hypothetical protein